MTSTTSVTQQTLLLQLLQQEQLQQAAAAQADATVQTKTAQTTAATNAAATTAASVDTSQSPQIGASFSAALSQLGSSQDDTTTHHGHHGHRKVDQAVQNYGEQGPSQEGGAADVSGSTAVATTA